MRANEIDLITLERLFYLDESFNLRWKIKRNGTKGVDSIAGYVSKSGYATIEIQGKQYRIHRIVYQMANKLETLNSDIEIDHVDLNKLNNNPNNLRASTASQNSRNRSKMKDNQSGFKGVTKNKKSWRARIRVDYELISLGSFPTKEQAYQAYSDAAKKYHQEFHRLE